MMFSHSGFCSTWISVCLIDFLLSKAHGNEPNKSEEPDVKYAVIGIGIGLLFSLCFVALKLYMLRKHMLDNELSEAESDKRPSFMRCGSFALDSKKHSNVVSECKLGHEVQEKPLCSSN